jgi:mRNA interferase MazF
MVKLREKLKPHEFKRGDVWLADLAPSKGHEQDKRRPVLIVQNDIANQYSPCITIAPITTYAGDKVYPAEVLIKPPEAGLKNQSLILCSQIRTLDKELRFVEYLGRITQSTSEKVDQALKIHLGLVRL